MGYIKASASSGINSYHDPASSSINEVLTCNNDDSSSDMIVTLFISSWQDHRDMGRSTGFYATFVQGGLLDYATLFQIQSPCQAKQNITLVQLHAWQVCTITTSTALRHTGTVCARDNHYNSPGGRYWSLTPILQDSQPAVEMAETARASSSCMHCIDHCF